MSDKAKHSPLPWKSIDSLVFSLNERDFNQFTAVINGGQTITPSGPEIRTPESELRENALFIVRACNAHYELLKAAKRALAILKATNGESVRPGNVLGALDAAITKAEAPPTTK